jgi:hypothetical protein
MPCTRQGPRSGRQDLSFSIASQAAPRSAAFLAQLPPRGWVHLTANSDEPPDGGCAQQAALIVRNIRSDRQTTMTYPLGSVVHTGARPRTHVCTLTYRRGSHWSCSHHPPADREPCMPARGRCCLASVLRFLETGIPSTGTACILVRPAPGSHAAPPTQPRSSLTPRITSLARTRGAPVGIRLVWSVVQKKSPADAWAPR